MAILTRARSAALLKEAHPTVLQTYETDGLTKTSTEVPAVMTVISDQSYDRQYLESLVIWHRPLATVYYFVIESIFLSKQWLNSLVRNRWFYVILPSLFVAHIVLQSQPDVERQLFWYAWWVGLGILSSVGLGTGLHTFLLYLGPHIAAVTMAAYECGTTDFPEPPYPDSIVCPSGSSGTRLAMTVWQVLAKVRIEAFCWGAGTAIGELPPYFVAKAHRLSDNGDRNDIDCDDNDENDEFEELERKRRENPSQLSTSDRIKIYVEDLVKRVGFFGILACASIPNPLFDIAGLTCGHFLVPFSTFFGATLIGKAVIKMHIQMLAVVFAFNDDLLDEAIHLMQRFLPNSLSNFIVDPIKELLRVQRQKLHSKPGTQSAASVTQPSLVAWLFEKFIVLMIAYFIISIVNMLAKSCYKRLHKSSLSQSTTTKNCRGVHNSQLPEKAHAD